MSLAFKIAADEIWDGNPESPTPRALCLGFTLISPTGFTFDGMIHRGDRIDVAGPSARLFRVGPLDKGTMRVNVILSDSPDSQRVQAFHVDPVFALFKTLPGLRRELPEVRLQGPVDIIVFTPH